MTGAADMLDAHLEGPPPLTITLTVDTSRFDAVMRDLHNLHVFYRWLNDNDPNRHRWWHRRP